jgi:hypothetical protein
VGIIVPQRVSQVLVFAFALGLLAGCGSSRTNTGSQPPPASAGFACSSAHVFTAAAGAPVHQSAALGDLTATLTGTSVESSGETDGLSGGVLTITASGQQIVRLPIAPPAGSDATDLDVIGGAATASSDDAGSLCLIRFTSGGPAIAFVALTTGGAHCCTVLRAVPAAAATDARAVDHDFGNYGPAVRTTTTGPVLVSADNAFAYAFASFAGSYPPVQVYTFRAGAYADVTRENPSIVQADLADHWKLYNDPSSTERLGILAGWVADKCLLDPAKEADDAWAFVDQQRAAGTLTATAGWPSGADFIASLHKLLDDGGYCAP